MTQKPLEEVLADIRASADRLLDTAGIPMKDRPGLVHVATGMAMADLGDGSPRRPIEQIQGHDEPPICSTVDAGEDQDLRDGILPERDSSLHGVEYGSALVSEPPEHVLDAMVVALRCHGEFGTSPEASRRNAEKAARDVWKVIASIPEDTIVGRPTALSRNSMQGVVAEGILVGALAEIAGVRVPREVRPATEVATDALAMVANLREI